MPEGKKGSMQTFNGRFFSLSVNDGIRMIFDMKGSRSLYLKVSGRQAYDLFRREVGIRPDEGLSTNFVMEMLFTGISWFSMGKMQSQESADRTLSYEVPNEYGSKKDVQLNFSTSEHALICLRIKYGQVTIRRMQG